MLNKDEIAATRAVVKSAFENGRQTMEVRREFVSAALDAFEARMSEPTDYADLEERLQGLADLLDKFRAVAVGSEADGQVAALVREARAAIAALSRERESARRFAEFALRHTFPERAKAHGAATVYSILAHHPYVTDNGLNPSNSEAK